MKTLEQIKRELTEEAQKKIAAAEREYTLREQLKIQPNFVHIHNLYKSSGSIKYDVKTKTEAMNIIKTFKIEPSYLCKCARGTSVKCFYDPEAKEVTEHLAGLHIDNYKVEIKFFVLINNEFWNVGIDLPVNLFGHFYKSEPRAKINYKKLFAPSPSVCELHRICKYAAVDHRGEYSFGEEIWAMYEYYEIERLLKEGE